MKSKTKTFVIFFAFAFIIGASVYFKYDIEAAITNFLVIIAFGIAATILGERFDKLLAAFIIVFIGVILIYSVFDDFIKTIKITAGLFIIQVGIDCVLEAFGQSGRSMMEKVVHLLKYAKKK